MDLSHQPRASLSTGSKRLFLFGGVGLLVVAVVLFAYFGTEIRANEPKAKAPAAIPVSATQVLQRTVSIRLQAIGNVEAFATVSVKARVDGQIVEVGFKEGEEVRQGQVLFKIDPRPYEATLRQAEAAMARDVAQREQALSQERRYKELLEKNFVSKDAYAQFRTNAETAAAVAESSRAAADSARLNLEYCVIRSPIESFAGKIQIQKGNLVKANDTNPLVVLNQVHPIYVNFSVPEQNLPSIRGYMAQRPLSVDAMAPNSDKPTASGTLIFIDNAVDSSTGTIKLRAQFQNKNNALWPGQFVNTKMTLYDQKDAIVVPTKSVQTGPNGQYVFVIKPDLTAEVRKVAVERTEGDSTIISSGLQKGEQVVTEGQLRLGPGSRVTIKS